MSGPPVEPRPPDSFYLEHEALELAPVAGDAIVVVVPLRFAAECLVLFPHAQVPALSTPLRYGLARPLESALRRLALDHPIASDAPSPVVGEPQKVTLMSM
jgi:hypothetical protein